MLNKFRRSIRKYPILSAELLLIILGFIFIYLTRSAVGNALLIGAALIGLVSGTIKLLDILRHGFFGIQLLQLTAIVFALFMKQPQTAAVLALAIILEQPFFGKNNQNLFRAKHAPLVKSLDIASLPFTVLIFLIGGALWTITRDSNRFLEIIAIASTAPMLLAAPLLIKNKMLLVSKNDIKITSARIFELLSDSQAIVLKKSGILTEKDLELLKIYTFGKNTKDQVIQVAAALAYDSSHPAARAIISYAETRLKVDKAKHAHNVIGEGIAGRKKGKELLLGRFSFLESKGVTMPTKIIDDTSVLVYVAENGVSIGAISFSEIPQAKLKYFVTRLKAMGFRAIEVVSGTSTSSTASVAKMAGISKYQGDMTTSEVIERVQSYVDEPVIFVGNDEQDEAILAQAGISVTTDPSVVAGSIGINDYSLEKLTNLLAVSKKTIKNAKQLTLITLAITLVFVVLAAAGTLTAFYAALVNLGITALILLLATDLKAPQPRR